MKLAVLAAALLLAPTVAAAPPRAPDVVDVRVGHDRALGFAAGDGLVVTVAHVLDDAVFVPAGSGRPTASHRASAGRRGHAARVVVDGRHATVVRVDRGADLALLRVPGLDGEPPRLGGDGARLLGRPATVVRHVDASVDGGPRRPALVVRARVSAGDSGAPVLTDSGRVAGVLFARSRTRGDTAYAVAAAAVGELLHSSP
jgi:Trypsin-like peptidase domain